MGNKKTNDPSAAPPPPPMFVGDDRPGTARVPEPPARPLLISAYEVDTGRFPHASSLSRESSERQPRAQPSMDESANKALGCFALLGLAVGSAFVETLFPLSAPTKILGAITVGAVVALLQRIEPPNGALSPQAAPDVQHSGHLNRVPLWFRRLSKNKSHAELTESAELSPV